LTVATKLSADVASKLRGRCTGCVHAEDAGPGENPVCSICVRNPEAAKGTVARCDSGREIYGLRDCYVATDRFEMDLRGETFFKGMDKRHGR